MCVCVCVCEQVKECTSMNLCVGLPVLSMCGNTRLPCKLTHTFPRAILRQLPSRDWGKQTSNTSLANSTLAMHLGGSWFHPEKERERANVNNTPTKLTHEESNLSCFVLVNFENWNQCLKYGGCTLVEL